MIGMGIDFAAIRQRVATCNYVSVAQLFLQKNTYLRQPLSFADIKPRLLGHWGTCPGINFVYANLQAYFADQNIPCETDNFALDRPTSAPPDSISAPTSKPIWQFVLGPGHGFPALQANLWVDGVLERTDARATRDEAGLDYLCRNFSAPGGFPSHASPLTPGVICEGGELGYALATAYGAGLGHPEKTIAVLLGDGELETATALASLNLVKLLGGASNARILPILHLNGYKISAPTIYGRKSERELLQLFRGFDFTPIITKDDVADFQQALADSAELKHPLLIFRSAKGATGPRELGGQKVAGSQNAHQIPLPHAKTDPQELAMLAEWLQSYHCQLPGAKLEVEEKKVAKHITESASTTAVAERFVNSAGEEKKDD